MDESAEDIEALWPSPLSRGCGLLFVGDSALPLPHAVISCSITEAPSEVRENVNQRVMEGLGSECSRIID